VSGELRKVTAFITRGSGADGGLLVFRHTASGVQVPAGTVEPGESFEDAVLREALEETGLADLKIVRFLGVRPYDLSGGTRVLLNTVKLRLGPDLDAPATGWSLRGGLMVEVREWSGPSARVVYQESDLEDESFVFARFEGWVPSEALASSQVRAFFHLCTEALNSDVWEIEEGRYVFKLYWTPLSPRPRLVAGQDEWVEEFYAELLAGTRAPE
jgi:8-oxo-dGTP pyrophosphatase MutT (NUDIX family)